MSRSIALVGMMGAGKTTIATRLGERLGRGVVDTDVEIRAWTGRSIPELFAEAGEAGFRDLERQVVEEVAKIEDMVISLGGGSVLRDDNVASLLLTGVIVHLDASPEVIVERLRAADQVADRPLLAGKDDLEATVHTTHAARIDRYREVADLDVDADRDPDVIVQDILEWALKQGDVLTPSEHEQVMN
jgi:shikimate kinase